MDFATAWDTLTVGDQVSVSDGNEEPSVQGGVPWWAWRSHNFTGEYVGRLDGPPRKLRFLLPRHENAEVTYAVCETIPHTFQIVTP